MLDYTAQDATARDVASHYCARLQDPLATAFFKGRGSPASRAEALQIARAFWRMTDMASQDHRDGVSILGDCDIEFWMHKLFNKTQGYFFKNGLADEWRQAQAENT